MSFIKIGNDEKCKVVGIVKTSEELTEEQKKSAKEVIESTKKAVQGK